MRCEPAIQGAYGEFAKRALAAAYRDRIPVSGTVELTAACNLACGHCYIPRRAARGAGLNTGQWLGIMETLADAGCLWIAMTGGEPLLRDDFEELYRHARSLGFLTTIMTNGTLIDERVADLLHEVPPLVVEVSVYGDDADTYELVTGDGGAFEAVIGGIDRLLARDVRIALKTTVTKANTAAVPGIERIAADRGLRFRMDGLINSRLDGDRTPLSLRVEPEVIAELELASARRQAEMTEARDRQRPAAMERTVFDCGAGWTTFNISWDGELSPCVMARSPGVNLIESSFEAAWNGPILEAVSARVEGERECDGCPVASLCSTCAGWGCMEEKDPQAIDVYLCAVAKARSQKLSPRPVGAMLGKVTNG